MIEYACPSAVCWPWHMELKCCSLDRNQGGPQRPHLLPSSLFRHHSLLSYAEMSPLLNEEKGVSAEEKGVRQEEEHYITTVRWGGGGMKCSFLQTCFKCKSDDKIYLNSVLRQYKRPTGFYPEDSSADNPEFLCASLLYSLLGIVYLTAPFI